MEMVNIFTKGRILVRNSVKFCLLIQKEINIFESIFKREKYIMDIWLGLLNINVALNLL